MNLLIDSHILIWWGEEDSRLGAAAHTAIADPKRIAYVSLATAWEIAIKQGQGKLRLPEAVETLVTKYAFEPLGITFAHTAEAGALPRHHGDPFDRMLVAQARVENLTLVTADKWFEPYDVKVIWA